MSNRFFVAVSLLILGFFLFAFSTVQNANNSLLTQIAEQQSEVMLLLQHKKMNHSSGDRAYVPNTAGVSPSENSSADVSALQNRIASLEARLTELETDTKPIITQIKAQQEAYEQQRKEMEEAMKKVYDIAIGNSPIRGNKNAPVTLVEFTDFQCPYCSRFHSISEDLLKAFPDKIRFVLKNFPLPFHPEAKPAAKAVLAAKEQGKYWEMVDAILKDNATLSANTYEELAKNIGLNVDKFKQDLKSKDADFEKVLADDLALAEKVNVRGTPTFYLNGKMTMPDPQAMKAAVNELLKGK